MKPSRPRPSPWLSRIALAGLCALATGAAAAPGSVVRDAELKSSAALDAATVGQLKAGAPVEILSFEGGWAKVKSEAGSGYTRMLNVRPLKAEGTGGNPMKNIDAIGDVARTGSTGNAATTGAKGLSKTELQGAQPNTGALEQFKASTGATASGPSKLKSRDVDLLPDDAEKR